MTTQEQLDLYYLVRQVIWRYKLDAFENAALERTVELIRKAKKELLKEVSEQPGLDTLRQEELAAYFDAMTVGIRARLANDVQEIGAIAAEYSLREVEDMLSIGGLVRVNTVAISPEQMNSFFGADSALPAWVESAWGRTAERAIKDTIDVGVLLGESYGQMVGRMMEHAIDNFTERDAVTIARTYVQTANVAAQFASYEANDDIVKGWIWSSVLEPFDPKTGGGTCLACSALDGQKFELNQGPKIPLHISCRCVARPWVKSWRELGVDKDEISEALRPYTIREGTVGAGGMREIQEVGRHQGSYKTWFEKQGPEMQERILGPGRYGLYSSGKVKFEDFISDDGRILRLDELTGGKMGAAINDTDIAAIKAYSGEKYNYLNRMLRGVAGEKAEYVELSSNLSSALKKMPVHSGPVYRAMSFDDNSKFMNAVTSMGKGKIFDSPGFGSASMNEVEARKFMTSTHNVLLKIESKNGRILGDYAEKKGEQEVLFDKGSTFRILKKKKEKNGTFFIEAVEE